MRTPGRPPRLLGTIVFVRNNIFQHLVSPIVPGTANGNVFPYNYSLDHFLLTQKDGTPWRRKAVERRTARWGTAAQVPECVPRRFRHLFATDLLRQGTDIQGTDIRYIQALLGHARLDPTEIYTRSRSRSS